MQMPVWVVTINTIIYYTERININLDQSDPRILSFMVDLMPSFFFFALSSPLKVMEAIQKAHDGKPVEKITKSRPPCVIL